MNSPCFCRVRVTQALVFSVMLCALCLSFVTFCWPWSCKSPDLTISVFPFWYFRIPSILWLQISNRTLLVVEVWFKCSFVISLSQIRKKFEYSQTWLTPPHTLCAYACPKPGTCNLMNVVVFMLSVTFFEFFIISPIVGI